MAPKPCYFYIVGLLDPVPNFSALSSHPSIDGKPYYNSSLFLNKNIDPTSIGL